MHQDQSTHNTLLQVGLKVEWGAGAGTMRYKEGEQLHLITFEPYSKRSKIST